MRVRDSLLELGGTSISEDPHPNAFPTAALSLDIEDDDDDDDDDHEGISIRSKTRMSVESQPLRDLGNALFIKEGDKSRKPVPRRSSRTSLPAGTRPLQAEQAGENKLENSKKQSRPYSRTSLPPGMLPMKESATIPLAETKMQSSNLASRPPKLPTRKPPTLLPPSMRNQGCDTASEKRDEAKVRRSRRSSILKSQSVGDLELYRRQPEPSALLVVNSSASSGATKKRRRSVRKSLSVSDIPGMKSYRQSLVPPPIQNVVPAPSGKHEEQPSTSEVLKGTHETEIEENIAVLTSKTKEQPSTSQVVKDTDVGDNIVVATKTEEESSSSQVVQDASDNDSEECVIATNQDEQSSTRRLLLDPDDDIEDRVSEPATSQVFNDGTPGDSTVVVPTKEEQSRATRLLLDPDDDIEEPSSQPAPSQIFNDDIAGNDAVVIARKTEEESASSQVVQDASDNDSEECVIATKQDEQPSTRRLLLDPDDDIEDRVSEPAASQVFNDGTPGDSTVVVPTKQQEQSRATRLLLDPDDDIEEPLSQPAPSQVFNDDIAGNDAVVIATKTEEESASSQVVQDASDNDSEECVIATKQDEQPSTRRLLLDPDDDIEDRVSEPAASQVFNDGTPGDSTVVVPTKEEQSRATRLLLDPDDDIEEPLSQPAPSQVFNDDIAWDGAVIATNTEEESSCSQVVQDASDNDSEECVIATKQDEQPSTRRLLLDPDDDIEEPVIPPAPSQVFNDITGDGTVATTKTEGESSISQGVQDVNDCDRKNSFAVATKQDEQPSKRPLLFDPDVITEERVVQPAISQASKYINTGDSAVITAMYEEQHPTSQVVQDAENNDREDSEARTSKEDEEPSVRPLLLDPDDDIEEQVTQPRLRRSTRKSFLLKSTTLESTPPKSKTRPKQSSRKSTLVLDDSDGRKTRRRSLRKSFSAGDLPKAGSILSKTKRRRSRSSSPEHTKIDALPVLEELSTVASEVVNSLGAQSLSEKQSPTIGLSLDGNESNRDNSTKRRTRKSSRKSICVERFDPSPEIPDDPPQDSGEQAEVASTPSTKKGRRRRKSTYSRSLLTGGHLQDDDQVLAEGSLEVEVVGQTSVDTEKKKTDVLSPIRIRANGPIISCLLPPNRGFERVDKSGKSSQSRGKVVHFEDEVQIKTYVPTPLKEAHSMDQKYGVEDIALLQEAEVLDSVVKSRPHLRQFCPVHAFNPVSFCSETKANDSLLNDNSACCDSCYCFICDVRVKSCSSWRSSSSQSLEDNHCCATDNSTLSAAARQNFRQSILQSQLNRTDGASAMPSFASGPGPFSPIHLYAQDDPMLTQCRRCEWYCRFDHRNFRSPSNPTGSGDLCHQCGRVASDNDFGKRQSQAYTPTPTDFFFGEKTIPFQIDAHDPRQMDEYQQNWANCGWEYKEADMEEDVFNHRFGEHPTLNSILECIHRHPKNSDGLVFKYSRDSLLFELLTQIMDIEDTQGESLLGVEIEGNWSATTRSGNLVLRVYLAEAAFHSRSSDVLTWFLGGWYNMFPYSLRELGRQFGEREKAHEELSFDSSSGSEVLGGVSSNDSSFVGTLKRYFSETFAEEVVAGFTDPLASTDTDSLKHGISLRQRCLLGDVEPGFHLNSLETKCREITSSTTSVKGMLNHLENLGHGEISSVEGLNVNLLDFQRQTLKWALERENSPGGIQNLFWAKAPVLGGESEEIYYSPILNCFSRNKPLLVRGGIINEDRALGSATTSLALILQNPAPSSPVSGSDLNQRRSAAKRKSSSKWDFDSQLTSSSPKRGSIISRGTLVVCHVSTYDAWISEAKAKLQNPDLVCKYYSPNRKRDSMELAMYPIVVTTYNVIKSDATYHAKKSSDPDYCPPLEQIRFWRVICEESHSMPAGFESRIVSVHKWLVSGDPVSDTFENLRHQLRFLGVDSIDALFDVFSKSAFVHAGDPKAINGSSSGRFGGLLFFLRSIMMRHTEGQTYIGTSTKITTLPGKSEITIDVDFDAYEKGEYEKLEAQARIICKLCVLNGLGVASTPVQDQLSKKLAELRLTCSIYGAPEKTKIVVAELQGSRETNPHGKTIVFSQYYGTLQAFRKELEQRDIHWADLSLDKSARERSRAVNEFQNDPNTTVFLLSPTTAALDINFLKASRIYFMEPLLDQVLEEQIVGSVYRIGQKHPVEIVHLATKNSIESRILQYCAQRPIASTNSTLNADDFDFLFGLGSDNVEL